VSPTASGRCVPGAGWETAFVATSALLGEPLEAIVLALGPSAEPARSLIGALQSPSREIRARALARGVAEAIVAVESSRLR
jgi:hypothetical protein